MFSPTLASVILPIVLAMVVIAPQARLIEVTTNTEEFLFPEHPLRIAYDEFRDQFGSDNFVLITLRHDPIFGEDFLSWLRSVHEALEERVPHVNEITSLINVRSPPARPFPKHGCRRPVWFRSS